MEPRPGGKINLKSILLVKSAQIPPGTKQLQLLQFLKWQHLNRLLLDPAVDGKHSKQRVAAEYLV